LSQSVNILLEGVPAGIDMQQIYRDLAALPGVREVHDLHIWAITSGQNSLTVHLVTEDTAAGPTLIRAAQAVAQRYDIEHTSVQVESPDMPQEEHNIHR
jgi:cobalt-zinc-cadmium efflux system protein